MATLQILQEESGGGLTLRLSGDLDGRAARQLGDLLDQAGTAEVVIDFTHVHQFLDLAIAILTRSLSARHVRMKGLCAHQEQMFRYFGVSSTGR